MTLVENNTKTERIFVDFLNWNYKDITKNNNTPSFSDGVLLTTTNKKGIHVNQLKIKIQNPLDVLNTYVHRFFNNTYVEDKTFQIYPTGIDKDWIYLKDFILTNKFSVFIGLNESKYFQGFEVKNLTSELQFYSSTGNIFIPKFEMTVNTRMEFNL